MEGTWEPVGVHPNWRISKYLPGGHFGPHYAGPYVLSTEERSLQTIIIYLNGDFDGGNTNFLNDEQSLDPVNSDATGPFCADKENIIGCVVPETGMGIVFNHYMLHEGEPLRTDVKYIMRSDVMYRRTSSPEMDPNEKNGVNLYIEGQKLEVDKKFEESINLYRRAFRLWPPLEFYNKEL